MFDPFFLIMKLQLAPTIDDIDVPGALNNHSFMVVSVR